MLNQQQYATFPLLGSGTTTTAEASYTAPTNFGVVCTAQSSGARIDVIDNFSLGTSVAGVLRLFACEGQPGAVISSISFSGTTATLTTVTNHGLSTGAFITVQGAFPSAYNVTAAAVTVTGLTSLTYTMASTPTIVAGSVGQYASTPAAPVYHLLKEIPIFAVVGSSTVLVSTPQSFSSALNADFMPILLPPGWSLRTTVSVTQTSAMQTNARGGNN